MMPTPAVSRPICVGPHWMASRARTLKLFTKNPNGSASSANAIISPRSSGRPKAVRNTPNGWTSRRAIRAIRFSGRRLSGSRKMLRIAIVRPTAAVRKTGRRRSIAASRPPMAGPIMVPMPVSAPRKPKRCARFGAA